MTAPETSRPSSSNRRLWLPPIAAVALACIVGGLGISGSSVGMYADTTTQRGADGLIRGHPRPIRSDEWAVRLPWVLAREAHGFADELAGGVGTHDMSVTDVPGTRWEVLLRPTFLPYHLLPASRAFAVEWWLLAAVLFTGVYALVAELTRRPAVAAVAGLLVVLSPAAQWWSNPTPFTTVGYGTGAVALLLVACRARTRRGRRGASALAGWVTAAFAATLYPPWQVGVALVVSPLIAAALVSCWRLQPDRRHARQALAGIVAPGAVVFVTLLGSFVFVNRSAFEIVAETVYPGERSAESGGGVPLVQVLGAPFDYAAERSTPAVVNGTNQSENAGGLALVMPVAVAVYGMAAGGRLRRPLGVPLLCVLGSSAFVLAWMLLPLPDWVGAITFLGMVPPSRLLLPLTLAGALAAALLSDVLAASEPPTRLVRWTSVGVFVAASLWAADNYTVDGVAIVMTTAAVAVVPLAFGVALLLGRRPAVGMALLAAFTAVQAANINPLQRDLAPILDNPLARAATRIEESDGGRGWVSFDLPATVRGTLVATGADVVSGVSFYPDRQAWSVLDPTGQYESVWNRYAHAVFTVGAPDTAPTIELLQRDALLVRVDPCAPELRRLGVRYVVSAAGAADACAVDVASVTYQGAPVTIQRLRGG